jgi:hypothetical protein
VKGILQTGLDPGGKPVRPPMHVFQLSHEDAAAIVAYLKALPPAEHGLTLLREPGHFVRSRFRPGLFPLIRTVTWKPAAHFGDVV